MKETDNRDLKEAENPHMCWIIPSTKLLREAKNVFGAFMCAMDVLK